MIKIIRNFLEPKVLDMLQKELPTAKYNDGKLTAKGMAKAVKNNQQLDTTEHPKIIQTLTSALLQHPEFVLYTMPEKMTSVIVSRYEVGQTYGIHSDNSVIHGVRTDVSFTLFLEDPKTYEGGELAIDTGYGETLFKLNAGDIVVYPTGMLHRVVPVRKGVRTVAVGWVESKIRDVKQRECIADLEWIRKQYLSAHSPDRIADLLLKTSTNLQRQWIGS
jgi:PKHD-type hydroxylase